MACSRVCACVAAVLGLGCPAADDGGSGNTDVGTDTDVGDTDTDGIDDWSELLEPVPGSRLRPVARVGEDGTRAHVRWQDTMLDTECEFRQAGDGALRCLPIASTSEPWRYADADCTQPVAAPFDLDPDATVTFVREGCFDEVYWDIGDEVTTEIYYNANGPCEVFSNDPGFRRLTPFPVHGFVAATVLPADGESRIVPLVLEADDGARQIYGAWDRMQGQEVAPGVDASGALRWFGRWEPRVSTIYYADPSCIGRVALRECVPNTAQPVTAHESEVGPCGTISGRHRLTGEIGAIYQRNDDGTCEPSGFIGFNRVWRVGDPIEDDTFAQAPTVSSAGPRLRHDFYANPEGDPVLPSARFFDLLFSALQCDWVDNPDVAGDLLCKPLGSALISPDYRDAACTQRTATRSSYDAACADGPPAYAFVIGMIAEIVEAIASPGGYHTDAAGDCVPNEGDTDSDGGWDTDPPEYYLVGDPLDVDIAHAMDVVE